MESKRYSKEIVQFGENVRRLRLAKGLTQLDLETATGIDRGDISRIENGRMDIQFSSIIKLAEGLEISTRDLFSFKNNP
jgi:transcriptional regulator with XRE-family HTH domain